MESHDVVSDPPIAASGEPALRRRILNAAFGAFMEHGYGGASTLEIATRAKVSKRELYVLFGSKQAMLRACIEERARRMLPSPPPPPARDRDALSAMLTAFGDRLVTEVCQPAVLAVHRLAVTEADHSPEIAQELRVVRDANIAALTSLLKQARDAGLLDDADPEEMATQFMSLLWGDLIMQLMQRLAEPPTAEQAFHRAVAATAALLKLHSPTGVDGSNRSQQLDRT
jgi:AcrR family transcriptional regulator